MYRATASPASSSLDALPPHVRAGWAPSLADAASLALAWARPGDVVVTFGVGEPWKIARAIVDGLQTMIVAEHVELSRLTTIGTGGPARAFAEPASLSELEHALAWAEERSVGVATVGLGSNLLAADGGIDMLVVRLTGELAAAQADGELLVAGGGATNAVCLHRARAAGLGRLRVRLRDPRHGRRRRVDECRRLRERLERNPRTGTGSLVRGRGVDDAPRARPLLPAFGASARPGRRAGRVPPAAATRSRDQGGGGRPRRAPQGDTADQQAHLRIRVQEPGGELGAGRILELCGLKGYRSGGALISPRHANFIENGGGATTADCLALMTEARRRAREAYGIDLEHEVVLLGELELRLTR